MRQRERPSLRDGASAHRGGGSGPLALPRRLLLPTHRPVKGPAGSDPHRGMAEAGKGQAEEVKRRQFNTEGSAHMSRIVETVTIHQDLDPYLSLTGLAGYSCLSVRTLRSLLRHPTHPLPHYRIGGTGQDGKRGAKILVRRSEFDRWMAAWKQQERAAPPDLDSLLKEALASVKGQRRNPSE